MDYCDIDYLEQYGDFTNVRRRQRAMLTVHITAGLRHDRPTTAAGCSASPTGRRPRPTPTRWSTGCWTRSTALRCGWTRTCTSSPPSPPSTAGRDADLAAARPRPTTPSSVTAGSWEDPTTITGFWAYSNTAPGDHRQHDGQAGDVAVPPAGVGDVAGQHGQHARTRSRTTSRRSCRHYKRVRLP